MRSHWAFNNPVTTLWIMKFLLLAFLFGLAAASIQDRWERARDNTVRHFMNGMDMAGPLRNAVGMPDLLELNEAEDEIKTELGKKLKEALDKVLDRIREALDKKEELKQSLLDKVKEIRNKLKDLHEDIGDKARDLLEKIKDRVKDYFKKLLEKITEKETRAISYAMEAAENELDLKEVLRKIRDMISEHISEEKIREYLEKIKGKVGKMAEYLLELIKNHKGLQALRDLIKRLLGGGDREARSLKEYWDRLKEFLKEKHLDFKQKFSEFGDWLKEAIGKGLEIAKDKATALKNIAKEVIDHSKEISKEVAIEALEALKPYKEDLGDLWVQLKEKVNEVMKRKD